MGIQRIKMGDRDDKEDEFMLKKDSKGDRKKDILFYTV